MATGYKASALALSLATRTIVGWSDISVSVSQQEIDITTADDEEWEFSIPTKKSMEIAFSLIARTTEAATESTIRGAFALATSNTSSLAFATTAVGTAGTGLPTVAGNGHFTSFDMSASHTDVVKASGTIKVQGMPTLVNPAETQPPNP